MAILTEQIITTPDPEYPENYGFVTATVVNTETGERSTASSEYDLFTKESEATASAIQSATDKL